MSTSQEWARYLRQRLTTHPEDFALPHYVKEHPSPKQAAALLHPARCLLFGGQAGGGKSSLGMMASLRGAYRPGASLILRRESVNLTQPGALIPRSHEWLADTDAHWRGDEKTWTFPSGFVLKFGHMEHEDDKHNYQSAEYDTIFFEELTEFTESQFRFMFSRQRKRVGSPNPLRTLAATNPGGVGHEWVAGCWGLGDYEGKPREPSWAFLPSALEDNPGIDAQSYEESLSHLTEFVRRQLRHGDWRTRPKGDLFKTERIVLVNPEEVPAGAEWRFWDLASTEETPSKREDASAGARGRVHRVPSVAVAVGPPTPQGPLILYVTDLRHFRHGPGRVIEEMQAAAESDGTGVRIVIEQEPGASGKTNTWNMQTLALPGYSVTGRPASGGKRSRWVPLEAAVEQGRVRFVRAPWNAKALGELSALTTDEKQDAKNGLHDDIADAIAGLYNECITASTPKVWRPGR